MPVVSQRNIVRKPYLVRTATRSTSQPVSSCVHCGKVTTREALFKDGSATVVEKYCDDCLKTEKFTAIMTFYSSTGT